MKYRVKNIDGMYYPQYKKFLFWRKFKVSHEGYPFYFFYPFVRFSDVDMAYVFLKNNIKPQ